METESKILEIAIIGAGISGIGTAYWLQKKCPNRTFEIFESRDKLGGTWSLFKYPGVRSDSDMFTFGYRFKQWVETETLASGKTILNYINSVVTENNIEKKINFNNKIIAANWSTEEKLWTLEINNNGTITSRKVRFLASCAGYYDYDNAHVPDFEKQSDFKGEIVIPQFWKEDLDYTNKKIIVVGSGATAITLLPSLAKNGAKHVTMLQRSPTYVTALPSKSKEYIYLKKYFSQNTAYKIVRYSRIFFQMYFYYFSKAFPNYAKKILLNHVKSMLPVGYDVAKHFTPSYNPWDQRLCAVPGGDLFKVISKGSASVETDHISHFTEKGIMTKSGKELEADIIVLATGLKIKLIGGVKASIDNKLIVNKEHLSYKGMLISNVPNFINFFGYTNASWTLRVDLISNYFCRLLNYLDKNNYTTFEPILDSNLKSSSQMQDLTSGYIQRSIDDFPKQGNKNPWKVYQNYLLDMLYTRYSRIKDGEMKFK